MKNLILCVFATAAMPAFGVSRDVLRLTDERLEDISTAIRSYADACGRLPDPSDFESVLSGSHHDCWSGPYLSVEDLKDPWRKSFIYKIEAGSDFSLRSIGVDGVQGTADDIVYGDVSRFWIGQYKPRPDNIVDDWRGTIFASMAVATFCLVWVLARALLRRFSGHTRKST